MVVTPAHAAPAAAPAPAPAPAATPAAAGTSARAKVIVEVAADAKLYVDEYLTKSEGKTERTFITPVLEAGKDYYYVLKAEIVRDGQTVTESRRVIVRAGQEARASFGAPAVAVSSKQ